MRNQHDGRYPSLASCNDLQSLCLNRWRGCWLVTDKQRRLARKCHSNHDTLALPQKLMRMTRRPSLVQEYPGFDHIKGLLICLLFAHVGIMNKDALHESEDQISLQGSKSHRLLENHANAITTESRMPPRS